MIRGRILALAGAGGGVGGLNFDSLLLHFQSTTLLTHFPSFLVFHLDGCKKGEKKVGGGGKRRVADVQRRLDCLFFRGSHDAAAPFVTSL